MDEGEQSVPHQHCPHCGHDYVTPLASADYQLLKAVKKLARHSGAASSKAIALEVWLSPSQVNRRMGKLARQGQVMRVGTRGGWRVAA